MIASQTESLPQELRGPELSQGLSPGSSPGLWRGKKGKKDGPGLFSKLLSGLLKNPGNGLSLSGAIPEGAAEGGEPGGRLGLKSGPPLGETPDKTPGEMPGEVSGGKPLRKTGGQKAFSAGPEFLAAPGEGTSGTEGPARGLKKPAGSRKGEDAEETLYLLSRAGIPAGKSRLPDDPEGETSPVSGREGAESGLPVEGGISLSQAPEASRLFHRGTDLSGLGPEFPDPGETGEGRRRGRRPEGAEGFAGLEGKLAGEFSRSGENRIGLAGTRKTETGKDEKRPAGARRIERRRERPGVFETRDLRSGQEAGFPGLKEAPEGKRLSGQEPGQGIDLSVELKNESRGGERVPPGGEKTLPQAFEDILARELHQNLNGDIVRHASVVLRDGGEGLIRLSLKPDTLGNVKIRLEMAENKITGHIVVESGEALRAFEREIGALEQAFKDSGFEGADLSMSLASGGEGADRQGAGEQVPWERPFFSERFAAGEAASRYDASAEKRDMLFAIGSANGLKPGNGRISVNLLI